jgi:DNA mismatch endonuclease (patch repair protein)
MGAGIESWASSEANRRSMQSNKGRDTAPELLIRKLLHADGLRYRVNFRPIPTLRRTADIVFTRARLAVFIDGCFWHGCLEHYQRPGTNREYWDRKVLRNRERDVETTGALTANGWHVLRVWEHEAIADPAAVMNRIRRELEALS